MASELFNKILIANRGEIACRVIKSAHELGIACVAVYVAADATAQFVLQADQAYHLSSDSYLDGAGILAIAAASGAQAIHPGYGYLSENADFAQACADAGVVFIGPPVGALRTMGSKSAAKTLLGGGQIPLVPGYHGAEQHSPRLLAEAERIGYPLLIKASAGGGGKGMRIVRAAQEFEPALASCQREASASFGNGQVLLEKYLQAPRHIEIQIFADTQGHCVYLFERDCSLQRRHQKVMEEAPAPGMTEERRKQMGETAYAVARAVDYVGAGTVEFIVDSVSGAFYFMEMNTRLQVEHPVTEMITGLDLVAWQLRIASGQPLPLAQRQLAIHGHAIEARLYAEDPQRGFLPSCGTLTHWAPPACGAHVRVDSGVVAGDVITPLFDPMLAKLIVWGETRAEALRRMDRALADYQLAGVSHNLNFLRRLVNHPAFSAGMGDTGLIEREQEQLLAPEPAPSPEQLALLALGDTLALRATGPGVWNESPGWRLSGGSRRDWHYQQMERMLFVSIERQDASCWARVGDERYTIENATFDAPQLSASINGRRLRATLLRHGLQRILMVDGERLELVVVDPLATSAQRVHGSGHLKAPMPGRVVAQCVELARSVGKGTPLLIMEAMKMEHTLFAPADGQVSAYHFAPGAQVDEGVDLLDFICAD